MTDTDTDFDEVTTDDYHENKPHETFTVTKETQEGELNVEIEFRNGRIHVSSSGAHSFSKGANLTREEGHPALYVGIVFLGDERTNLTIGIPSGVHRRLGELEDEHEEWRQDAEDWLARQPLRFHAEEHEYKTGTYRTKYHRSAVVLKPNKRERNMTELEETLYEAMRDEYGAADGYPEVPEDIEEGDVVSREEVADGNVAERWRRVMDERKEQERWEEIVAEHPSLRSAPASPEDVEKAFREARQDGEKKEIAAKTMRCSEPSLECDIDNVVLYATPDRDIETRRIHTH